MDTPSKKRSFKQIISFVKQIHIESRKGQFGDNLEVLLWNGKYMLNSPNATYSYEDRYTSYRSALYLIKPELLNVRSVLVLGLGLGSIPQMLQKIHKIGCDIHCVEYDKTIIELAEKYYPASCDISKIKIHHSDALEWMKKNTNKFDLITVDLFIDKHVPEKFYSEDFMISLKNALSKQGVLLFSRLKENYKSERSLHQNLQKVFLGGKDIDTGGNLIYCFKTSAS